MSKLQFSTHHIPFFHSFYFSDDRKDELRNSLVDYGYETRTQFVAGYRNFRSGLSEIPGNIQTFLESFAPRRDAVQDHDHERYA
jgi:hypothetical protein